MDDMQNQINGAIDETLENLENKNPSNNQGTESGGNPSDDQNPPVIFDDDELKSDAVIDGNTPYLDIYEEYYNEIMDYLAGNDIPDEIREIVEAYLNAIKFK